MEPPPLCTNGSAGYLMQLSVKELQMVFLTSTVINSNGIMKELERKIKCGKVDVMIGYLILPLQMLTSEV